jgi:hypothetical protein
MTHYEVISTEYVTVTVTEDGKEITIKLADGVKISRHQNQLRIYIEKLYSQGVKKINADQISLPYLNRGLNLIRGNRRLDLVYYKEGRIHECEFKTRRECGLDITYHQIEDMKKHCQNFILLIPQSELLFVTDTIRNRKIKGVTVDTWDT